MPLTYESYRPNWKSLESPGVLPLTTDYCPDKQELERNYTENFYSLTLPEEPGDFGYKDYDDLILEMVCQRLSQDFQLYIKDSAVPTQDNFSKDERKSNRVSGIERHDRNRGSRTTYVLTMGHQMHVLDYYPGTREVHVKIYVHRHWTAVSVSKDAWPYEYLLYDDIDERFQPVSLSFKGVLAFYNWNQLDHVVCGYGGELTTLVRYRRQMFSIIPQVADQTELNKSNNEDHEVEIASADSRTAEWKVERITMEEENRIVSGFQKFLSWLQSKASDPVEVAIRRRFHTVTKNILEKDISLEVSDVPRSEGDVHITEDNDAVIPFKPETMYTRIDLHSSKTGRYEWIQLEYDTVFSPYQCFHLQVQWMVASGSSTNKDFVAIMLRRAHQAGIKCERFPEYCSSTAHGFGRRVSHPFVLPKLIPLSIPTERVSEYYTCIVIGLQVECGFVLDRIRHYGRQRNKWYTLVHKQGYVFVHLGEQTLEIVPNFSKPFEEVKSVSKTLYGKLHKILSSIELQGSHRNIINSKN